jgi:23S rRNA (pseudouridine1915-N3)-methyltransferase
MRLVYRLAWLAPSQDARRAFKSKAAGELFQEYGRRAAAFNTVEVRGALGPKEKRPAGTATWLCDRGAGARVFSSAELAHTLAGLADRGVRALEIVVGGADGFSSAQLKAWAPALRWSFGPLTLPHELAAVVAAEQVYRAWTIARGLPYHH